MMGNVYNTLRRTLGCHSKMLENMSNMANLPKEDTELHQEASTTPQGRRLDVTRQLSSSPKSDDLDVGKDVEDGKFARGRF